MGQGGWISLLETERPSIHSMDMSPNGTYGCFVVEPLDRGYGITLGNSLRRVLLSSLPGAAVTTVKIDGVLHEFSTIPGVVEDVTEILLNIKNLAIRMYTDEPQLMRLEADGEGPVRAGDIMAGQDIEIVNPDLHICTLDRNGRIRMELTVERGRGYTPADRNKKPNQPIGVIPVDSIFSPVRRVNFTVDNTRIGQITNYDRLTLEVWTNGAIRPDEAVSTAARILNRHINLFVSLTDSVGEEEVPPTAADDRSRLLDMSIDELDLSVRSYNCLKRAGINTIGELVSRSAEEMMKVRNLGRKSLDEVEEKLARFGLSLKPSSEE